VRQTGYGTMEGNPSCLATPIGHLESPIISIMRKPAWSTFMGSLDGFDSNCGLRKGGICEAQP